MEESAYRKRIQETFDRIERAFENVDPDRAECEQSHGSMTITFEDESRCILSAQPSVRQLWLAIASRGTAVHFVLDAESGLWKDDKGKGLELLALLGGYLKEKAGLSVKF